jgi:hypothetical protein
VSVSPLMRRRLASFRAARRGYWSFWIFLALFVLSLGADLLANDRPLLVRHDGRLRSVLRGYPETGLRWCAAGGLSRSRRAAAHRGARMDGVAAGALPLRHD